MVDANQIKAHSVMITRENIKLYGILDFYYPSTYTDVQNTLEDPKIRSVSLICTCDQAKLTSYAFFEPNVIDKSKMIYNHH